jgi:hypothetical protein
MEKRGASNIEFILAFMLFAGFLVTILYLYNPTKDLSAMESSRDYVMNKIIKNTSIELDAYSIVITETATGDIQVNIEGIDTTKNVRAVDYYGKPMTAVRSGDNICLARSAENFATLYFSEDLDEITGSCSSPSSINYRIASSITSEVISEKRILLLNNSYYSNYPLLKEQLGIPESVEFSFSLEFPDGETINAERAKPLSGEVFSETKLREVLRKEGSSKFGYLTVQIW